MVCEHFFQLFQGVFHKQVIVAFVLVRGVGVHNFSKIVDAVGESFKKDFVPFVNVLPRKVLDVRFQLDILVACRFQLMIEPEAY